MARDYAFHQAIEQPPRRLRWIVARVRRMLRRLLGPVWEREQTLFEEIDSDLEQVRREIEELRAHDEGYAPTLTYLTDRLDALDRQVRETAALGWDHAALVRRLSVLEDRLQAQPVEGADADAARG
jgi:hypothetical protein